jgi:hypothetical protein
MDIDTSLLPPVAKLLVRRLGLNHALAIIQAWGGLPLYVPKRGIPSEFVADFGQEAAEALYREFRGDTIGHVPSCGPALLAVRNRAIVQAAQDGASIVDLARLHKLSWRQTHNIVHGRRNGREAYETDDDPADAAPPAAPPAAPAQPDLFAEPAP